MSKCGKGNQQWKRIRVAYRSKSAENKCSRFRKAQKLHHLTSQKALGMSMSFSLQSPPAWLWYIQTFLKPGCSAFLGFSETWPWGWDHCFLIFIGLNTARSSWLEVIWVFGEGNRNPLQYSCLGNPMDRGAWAGYSTQGCKESDTI